MYSGEKTMLDTIESKGIDLSAPADYTDGQLNTIRMILAKVDEASADVVIAALEGYGDSVLLHPSLGLSTEAKTATEDDGSIQGVTGHDLALSDALDLYSNDGPLFDWLVKKVSQAQSQHPQGKMVEGGKLKTSLDKTTSTKSSTGWWIVGGVVLALVILAAKK